MPRDIVVEHPLDEKEIPCFRAEACRTKAFVAAIRGSAIDIAGAGQMLNAALSALGAARKSKSPDAWTLQLGGDGELPATLSALRDLGVAFEGGEHGWPPAEILADYRDRGLVSGEFWEVVFSGPCQAKRRKR
jgi:hypothetical protein